jgi:hypothetical protein
MFSYYKQEKLDREREQVRTAEAAAHNPKKLARYLSKRLVKFLLDKSSKLVVLII